MNQIGILKPTNSHTATARGTEIQITAFPHSELSSTKVLTDEFIAAMRGAASGVNIITTDGPAGRLGLTVSAFASVSAEPPSLLVCVNQKSPICSAILRNRCFGVNILAASQRCLADTFAGRPEYGAPYDFAQGSWTCASTFSPLLNNAVAGIDCTLENAIDSGSHTIFIGLVSNVHKNSVPPLLYTDRAYHKVCPDS